MSIVSPSVSIMLTKLYICVYIYFLFTYVCLCELTAICFSNQSSFKQFPITYKHLHHYTLLYPIMTTKIPLWQLNQPFSRTVHLLEEGGGQEEDTNCTSENYETEEDFAPFRKVLNQRSKSSSALENLRKSLLHEKCLTNLVPQVSPWIPKED